MGLLHTQKYWSEETPYNNCRKNVKNVDECIEMEVQYKGNSISNYTSRSQLLKASNEINILVDCRGKHPGIHYTISQIKFHLKTQGIDAVCKCNVNLAFNRPKQKTKTQKIQKGTNNEGKWKDARMCQAKQILIILNRLPDETK